MFVIDADTGEWATSGVSLTHEQGLRIAASVLPGIPAELLDKVYSAWLESDGVTPEKKTTHLVEARALVSSPESAMLVTGILHGVLHGIEPEPLVCYAPLRHGLGVGVTGTLSLSFAEDAVRVYRDGMVLPS